MLSTLSFNFLILLTKLLDHISTSRDIIINVIPTTIRIILSISFFIELIVIKAKKKSISDVLIIPMIEDLTVPIEIASELRKSDIKTEIYLNNKKLKAKFKYADKLEIPYVVVIGEDEIKEDKYKLKDMKTGNEQLVDISQIIRILKQ